MLQVLRKEKKFLLHRREFYQIKGHLDAVLHPDPYAGALGYSVRSLYFDTPYDGDYFDKVDGLELRRKIRLRCYRPNDEMVKLELKQKQGDLQLKRSLSIVRSDAMRLCQGDYTPLLHYRGDQEDFAAECYALMHGQCYRPKAIVEYRRLAYIGKENRIRITLDQDIVATESCWDLFSPSLNMNPVLDADCVVLEVKYNHFLLEYFQQALRTVDRSEISVSKYVLARQHGYNTGL